MGQVLLASGAVATTTTYVGISSALSGGAPANISTAKSSIITAATTARNLYITCQDPTPGTLTVTMRKNGVATTLTVTIASGYVSGLNSANTVALVAGDIIDFTTIEAGGATSTSVSISFELD